VTLAILGWSLIHFTWQGGVVALGLALCLRLLGSDAVLRYAASSAALLVLCALPGVDVALLHGAVNPTVREWGTSPAAGAGVITPILVLAPAARVVALVWLAVAAVLLSRTVGGWWVMRGLTVSGARPARAEWRAAFAAAARRVPVRRPVVLLESARVGVPTVIGLRRPVILLPVAGLAGLAAVEREGILAHELAHVRRADVLANLVQVLIEAVLFFHPAVWWVSRTIRHEREASCDLLAAAAIGDARRYARALARLEVGRTATSPVALAASGGSLFRRLQRLTGPSARAVAGWARGLGAATAGSALAAGLLLCIGAMVLPDTLAALERARGAPPAYVVHARDDAGSFTIAVARGQVVRAVVGGVAVPRTAIRQRGDSVMLPWGAGHFTIRLHPTGGFSWSSRTP
jgi:bla regulator protein blaR1